MTLKRTRCDSSPRRGRQSRREGWGEGGLRVERWQPSRQAFPERKPYLADSAKQMSERSRINPTCVGLRDLSPTPSVPPHPSPLGGSAAPGGEREPTEHAGRSLAHTS